MTVRTLPRPRTFEDMCDRLEKVETNVALVTNGVGTVSGQIGGITRELAEIRKAIIIGRAALLDADSSYNDLNALVSEGAQALYRRAKDPRDPMDSERARAIAREVNEQMKNAEDAKSFRTWRMRGWQVALAILTGVATLVAAALAGHYGWPH